MKQMLSTLLTEAGLVKETLLVKEPRYRTPLFDDKIFVYVHGISPRFCGRRVFKRARDGNEGNNNGKGTSNNIPVAFFNYDSEKGVEKAAESLKRFMKTLGEREYLPVGHSLGATVIRYFVECLGGDDLVARAACIAAAHHGTYLCYLRSEQSAVQLRPGSSFLQQLNARALSIPYLNIWTPEDECIIPRSSAILDGARNVRLDGVMHYSILADPRTHQHLDDFFAEEK